MPPLLELMHPIHYPELAEVMLARIRIPFLQDLYTASMPSKEMELTANLDELCHIKDQIQYLAEQF